MWQSVDMAYYLDVVANMLAQKPKEFNTKANTTNFMSDNHDGTIILW